MLRISLSNRARITVLSAVFAMMCGYACAQNITIGDTHLEGADDSGNGDLVLAQQTSLSQSATIESLSFYVTQASGSLTLGIFNSTGPKGGPGTLLAATNSFATTNGWDTAHVVTPVSLSPGNYWLAYLPSSSNLSFLKQNYSGKCAYMARTYTSGLPSVFSTLPSNCTPTTWSFYATLATGAVAVSGKCGSANDADLTSAPTTNLCSVGTASAVRGSGPWSWSCAGNGAGALAICAANLLINGACGAANGAAATSSPRTNLCSTGTASTVAGTGPWSWTCAGSNGGATQNCSAPLRSAIDGQCGPASGMAVTSAPTTNLCSNGMASTVAGTGPWTWICAGSNGGTSAACSAPLGTSSAHTPTLIQHVASSANPIGLGIAGNKFKIPLPNPVRAGNSLILGITYPHGETPTIADSNGNVWPKLAAASADAGPGDYVTGVWVLPNAKPGQTTITVAFASAVIPFNYVVSEFNHIATANPVSGSSVRINHTGPSLNSGAFTPQENNVNGGNLIWSYYALAAPAGANPTRWVPGTGFALLDADIAWTNDQGFPHASQYEVQPTAAAINPGITATSDNVDPFNGVTVALKAASAGTAAPAGIHINKIIHQSWVGLSPSETLNLQLPASGNLRVLVITAGLNNIDITRITDSDGGIWKLEQTGGDSSQIWYAANTPANPNLTVSIHTLGASPTNSARFFDIQGAAASPLDVAAGTDLTVCSSRDTINDQPVITPTGANELVIATMGIGAGPGLGLASGAPTGGVWDLATYSGESDNDLMENADALAHFYNTTTAAEHWNWSITSNGDNSCSAEAAAFK